MSSHASLNHIYRTVWNQALGAMVAVAEISSSQGRSSGASSSQARVQSGSSLTRLGPLSLGIALAWGAVPALANPVGGVAIHGQATLSSSQPNSLLVTTQNGAGTRHSAINWQSFSIPSGNTTYFQQPNAASTVINRVVSNTPSLIFGTLGSNGHVVLVNQSGIAVGAGAVVDTAGFTAAALGMSDADALSGRLRFGSAGPDSTSGISVQGQIMARGGDLVLIAPKLDTGMDALLQAPNGSTILAAGQQVEITGRGLEGIRLQVQAPTDSALNLGSLQGNAVGMFASTLKHSGLIQANAVSVEGGKVLLKAQDQLEIEGRVLAQGLNGQGGVVHATADKVALKSTSRIDASGASGGGEVLLGGGWQGHDARLENAQQTVIATGAQISADATVQGNGGTVVVWSDGATRFGGSISARGGVLGGNGGRAEVSGKQYLDFRGAADLTASQGRTGLLLLDPDTLTIGTTADVNGDSSVGDDVTGSFTAGLTGYGSQITATQVSNLLNTADLSLAATGDINVNSAISKTSGAATTLSLTSSVGHVYLDASIGGTPSSPLNLILSGNAGVLQRSGVITAPTLTATALGDYSAVGLDGGINNVGSASFTAGTAGYGGSVSFKNSGALSLGNVTASSLSIDTSAGDGAITQQSATKIELTSSATFATRSGSTGGGSITLNNTNNVIPSLSVNGAGVVSVTDSGTSGINVNAVTADSLTLLAQGSISSLSRTETTGNIEIRSTGNDINYCSDGCGTMVAGGTIKMQATGNLSFGGTMSSSASGDAITLIAGSAMSLSGYGGSITTPNGRSLAYVNYGLTHDFSLLAPSFKQYNYTTGATILGSGNGLIYTNSTAATLTSSLSGTVSKIYDAALGINLSGATFGAVSGAIDGDVVTSVLLSGGTATLNNKDVGSGKQVSASGMTVSGVSGGNGIATVYGYLTSASGNIGTVTAKTLNMSGLSVPVSKVYDATTAAVVNGTAAFTTQAVGSGSTTDGNAYTGDTLNLVGTAVGTYNSKDVATATTVSFSGLTLSGAQAGNYSLSMQTPVNATITPKSLTASVTAPSKVYDGSATAAPTLNISAGLVGSETVSATGTASFNSKDVSTASMVTVSSTALANGSNGGLASNYSLAAGQTVAANITKKALSATITAPNKVYDGSATSTPTLTISAGLVGSETVTATGTASFNSKDVLTANLITVSSTALADGGNGGLASNYSLAAGQTVVASISAKTLSATVAALNKVYDGNTSATPTLNISAGLVGSETVSASGTASFNSKDVLTANMVTVSSTSLADGSNGGLASNYSLAAGQSTAASITPKSLTANVTASNKVYDGSATATPTLNISAGLVGSETVTATGTASFNSKDVLTANMVTVSSTALADGSNGGLASNYSLVAGQSVAASISAKTLSATVAALNKVYDGSATATPTLSITGGLVGSETVTATGTASFNSKDVLTANLVTVNSTALVDGSGLASNYSLAAGQTTAASITPKTLTANVTAPSKVYDGNTVATPTLSITGGLVGSETVTATGSASFNSKDVLTANLVTVSSTALADGSNGGLASNYSLAAGQTTAASIQVRPLANWIASGNGAWSTASNWDALPDGSNVLTVAIPTGITVLYDAAVGATQLDSINSTGTVAMAGGSLTIANKLNTVGYTQTAGTLGGAGSLIVSASFYQSGGSIGMGGSVSLTQSTGSLNLGSINASSITLSAPTGGITQTTGLTTTGLLLTQAMNSIVLNNAGNHVASFSAATTGPGNVELTNVGALDVQGINAANGNITLVNTGGISTSGSVVAHSGTVSMTANSPLTVGSGGISANGNITLTATNLTSAGNMTLNGNLTSSAGAITLSAANNFVQNSTLTAAQGINVTAGGSMSFGAFANSVGNPLQYLSNGQSVVPPGNYANQSSAPGDFVVAFLNEFENTVTVDGTDLFSLPNQDINATDREIEICTF